MGGKGFAGAVWTGQPLAGSLDQLIRLGEQMRWHVDAERLGGLEVGHQLKFGRRLHRLVNRPYPLKNPAAFSPKGFCQPKLVDLRVERRRFLTSLAHCHGITTATDGHQSIRSIDDVDVDDADCPASAAD
jgi:hypothetical protein